MKPIEKEVKATTPRSRKSQPLPDPSPGLGGEADLHPGFAGTVADGPEDAVVCRLFDGSVGSEVGGRT